MKVLVTGANGFVGQALTQKLTALRDGLEHIAGVDRPQLIRVLTRHPLGLPLQSKNLDVTLGDITNLDDVISASRGIDVIFHLAGVVGYTRSERPQMERVNVLGTQNVVSAYKVNGCQRLVHMSSVATVGATFDGKTVIDETFSYNLGPLDLGYFETKRAAENIVLENTKANHIRAVILNPSNIYGAGDAQKGSRSTQVKVARGQFPFYTSGGVSVTHIDDVVMAAIRSMSLGRSGERYILSGENLSIQRLFSIIAECAAVAPPKWHLPNPAVKALATISAWLESAGRKGLVSSESAKASILFHWYDCSKAKAELKYTPRPAVDAIRESVEWMKSNGVI
jgi:dihydroflavonol-4-reductase